MIQKPVLLQKALNGYSKSFDLGAYNHDPKEQMRIVEPKAKEVVKNQLGDMKG